MNSLIYLAFNNIEFIFAFIDSGDPLANVLDFKKNFESEYSLEHPTFYQGLYSQVHCLSLTVAMIHSICWQVFV